MMRSDPYVASIAGEHRERGRPPRAQRGRGQGLWWSPSGKRRLRHGYCVPARSESVSLGGRWQRGSLTLAASRCDRIVELDELDRLAGAWDRLASRSGSPIGQYIWARACAEALGDQYSLDVLAIGPRERPIAIAPLARRRRPMAPLELLGVHELREPMDFLYADAPAAAALVRVLAKPAGPVEPEARPRQLAGPGGDRGRLPKARARAQSRRRRLPLHPPRRAPQGAGAALSARRRSDLRRAQRRAARLGEVSYETLAPSPAELEPLLEEVIARRGRRLEGEGAHRPRPRPDAQGLLPALCGGGLLEGHPPALLPADRRPGRGRAARGGDRRSILAAQGGLRRAVRALLPGLAAVAGDDPARGDAGLALV